MNNFLVYVYLAAIIIFNIVIWIVAAEQFIRVFKKRAPEVSSRPALRNAVVKQIAIEQPNAKAIFDMGAGWGAMISVVAKKYPNTQVSSSEIMIVPYVCAQLRNIFKTNVKISFGNFFKFLDKTNKKYDVGIAYLLTPMMKDVQKYKDRFRVLLVLDFPLPDTKYDKKIKLNKDFLGQHWLYVYRQ